MTIESFARVAIAQIEVAEESIRHDGDYKYLQAALADAKVCIRELLHRLAAIEEVQETRNLTKALGE